jgi:hypothetical protein
MNWHGSLEPGHVLSSHPMSVAYNHSKNPHHRHSRDSCYSLRSMITDNCGGSMSGKEIWKICESSESARETETRS